MSRTESAVVAGIFAGGTRAVELHSADAADVVLGHVPSPGGHRVPFFDGDFHGVLLADAELWVQGGWRLELSVGRDGKSHRLRPVSRVVLCDDLQYLTIWCFVFEIVAGAVIVAIRSYPC